MQTVTLSEFCHIVKKVSKVACYIRLSDEDEAS